MPVVFEGAPHSRWPCCGCPWCWKRAPESRWPCCRSPWCCRERLIAAGRVGGARGVGKERLIADGRPVRTARVFDDRHGRGPGRESRARRRRQPPVAALAPAAGAPPDRSAPPRRLAAPLAATRPAGLATTNVPSSPRAGSLTVSRYVPGTSSSAAGACTATSVSVAPGQHRHRIPVHRHRRLLAEARAGDRQHARPLVQRHVLNRRPRRRLRRARRRPSQHQGPHHRADRHCRLSSVSPLAALPRGRHRRV